jgi:hypothetical protein
MTCHLHINNKITACTWYNNKKNTFHIAGAFFPQQQTISSCVTLPVNINKAGRTFGKDNRN